VLVLHGAIGAGTRAYYSPVLDWSRLGTLRPLEEREIPDRVYAPSEPVCSTGAVIVSCSGNKALKTSAKTFEILFVRR